ncbi:MAG: glycosyltransferase family 2 protein [Halioglobus sp.]
MQILNSSSTINLDLTVRRKNRLTIKTIHCSDIALVISTPTRKDSRKKLTVPTEKRTASCDLGSVSVVIPCLNQAESLGHAVASVLRQRVPCEIVVVDDGSSMEQAISIRRIGERFGLRVLGFKASRGPAAARNLGINASDTQFIAFLDADDVWIPGKLQAQLSQMHTRGQGFTYTRYANVSGTRVRAMPAPARLRRDDLLRNTAIGCSSVVLSRRFIGESRFPEAPDEDLAFWATLLGQERTAYLAGGDIYVHRMLGRRPRNKFNAAWRYWRTLRDTLHIPTPEAMTHFIPYAHRAARKHWVPLIRTESSRRTIGEPT